MRTIHEHIDEAIAHVCGKANDSGTAQTSEAFTRYLGDELKEHPIPEGWDIGLIEGHWQQAQHRAHNRTVNDVRLGIIRFDPTGIFTLSHRIGEMGRWLRTWMNATE